MNQLTVKGIHVTVTIHKIRQKNCIIQSSKMMDKQERDTHHYRFDSNHTDGIRNILVFVQSL